MEFCCSCFRVQMHKPLVHESQRASIYHQGTEASLLELRRFMTLHGSIIKIQDKNQPPSQIPNPPNAIGCPPLVFRGFKIQIPINITKRPSHVQGKQPHLPKASFLEIWPYMGEKENSPKWIGWMEAWWMSFSFRLSIYHSWSFGEYGWIRWPCGACKNESQSACCWQETAVWCLPHGAQERAAEASLPCMPCSPSMMLTKICHCLQVLHGVPSR